MKDKVMQAVAKLVEASTERPLLVTPGVAAKMLGCSRTTVYALIRHKALRTAAIGEDNNRILVSSIEAYCENGGLRMKKNRKEA